MMAVSLRPSGRLHAGPLRAGTMHHGGGRPSRAPVRGLGLFGGLGVDGGGRCSPVDQALDQRRPSAQLRV